jgi:uncharacterized Zn finger protein (UPF0148 family)
MKWFEWTAPVVGFVVASSGCGFCESELLLVEPDEQTVGCSATQSAWWTEEARTSCPIGQKLLGARLLPPTTQLNATMALTALDKGKGKAVPETHKETSESGSSSSSASSSDSDSSSSESESEDEVTPEYLESLLEKARQSAAVRHSARKNYNGAHEEEMIKLSGSTNEYVPSCLVYIFLTVLQVIAFIGPRKTPSALF